MARPGGGRPDRRRVHGGWSAARDYYTLTKPGIAGLALTTVFAGWWAAAPAGAPLAPLWWALLGTGLASAGTGALNMILERPQDLAMARTKDRPLPGRRITPGAALRFGLACLLGGLAVLAAAATPLAAALTALTALLYLFAYTPLKPVTSWCVLVGAVPGALPPVIGWAAATGTLGVGALVLFLIQFFWQVPHFTAIAWIHRADYARVGWRMLPAPDADGVRAAGRTVIYTAALIGAALTPAMHEGTQGFYTGWSLLLGFLFALTTVRFLLDRSTQAARWVLRASLVYLPALLVLLALSRKA